MILKSTVYLTSDRLSVVPENDARAAFLIGRAGQEIPDKVAKKLGLIPEVTESPETKVQERESGLFRRRRKKDDS